jgi:UDP-glucose 4-epimerase
MPEQCKRMRVLVTGGAGFIGGNLVRALVARGDEVVVLDNLVLHHSLVAIGDVADRVAFVHGDVRCPEDLARVGAKPFDRVYHLAGSFANELSVEHPVLDARSNVDGTRHVIGFAREVGCGLFVYAGSSSSYGDAPVPTDEDAPIRPQTPYARSKHAGEICTRESGLAYAVLRLFNVYGPGDPPGRYRNAIPNMMRELDRAGGQVRVFGRDATRDFTYVADVVRVLVDAERAAGQVVNVGTGVETPVVELVRRILALFGLPPDRMSLEPPRPWDGVTRRCASTARFERLFGYRLETPLADGLRETARWLHDAGHLERALP